MEERVESEVVREVWRRDFVVGARESAFLWFWCDGNMKFVRCFERPLADRLQ